MVDYPTPVAGGRTKKRPKTPEELHSQGGTRVPSFQQGQSTANNPPPNLELQAPFSDTVPQPSTRFGVADPFMPDTPVSQPLGTIDEIQAGVNKSEAPKDAGMLPKLANKLGLPRQAGLGEGLGKVGEKAIGGAAEIIDGIASIFLSKKGVSVSTAENSLNDAITAISQDTVRVAQGDKSPEEAKINFENAIAALGRLERTNHGIGKLNLRYWLGGGADVAAEIIRKRQLLIDMRKDLLDAEAKYKAGQATVLQDQFQAQQAQATAARQARIVQQTGLR